MKKIILYGKLARFGKEFELNVRDTAEAIRALCCQLPGFEAEFKEGSYYLLRDNEIELTEEQLHLSFGKARELHILPEAVGAKRGGLGKAILGIAVIGVAIALAPATGGLSATAISSLGVTYGNIAMFGASLALTGIGQLISPTPRVGDYGSREQADERPSFIFNGPVNTVEQGQPVPLVYGTMRVGSVVISAGLTAEQI
jgi:predicted phage tail protein